MNLVRGGDFAPSLELKPFVSIETHPPTLFGLSRGLQTLCTSSLGLGAPARDNASSCSGAPRALEAVLLSSNP